MSKQRTTPQEIWRRARRFFGCDKQDQLARFLGSVEDSPRFLAPQRLREHKTFFTDEMVLRQHERADWQHVDPRMMEFAAAFLLTLRKKGVPAFAHSAFRTRDEQNALYAQGRSLARWPKGAHCQGKAVDIVHARYAWQLTGQEWAYFGKVGQDVAEKLNLKVAWGGLWTDFYDPAHWELSDWRANIRKLEVGESRRFTPSGLRKHIAGR